MITIFEVTYNQKKPLITNNLSSVIEGFYSIPLSLIRNNVELFILLTGILLLYSKLLSFSASSRSSSVSHRISAILCAEACTVTGIFVLLKNCPRIKIFRKFLSYGINFFVLGQKFSENYCPRTKIF